MAEAGVGSRRSPRDAAEATVREAYRRVLLRDPDPGALAAYVAQLTQDRLAAAELIYQLVESKEFGVRALQLPEVAAALAARGRGTPAAVAPSPSPADPESVVREAFASVLGREPEAEALGVYSAHLREERLDAAGLMRTLLASDEFRLRLASAPSPTADAPAVTVPEVRVPPAVGRLAEDLIAQVLSDTGCRLPMMRSGPASDVAFSAERLSALLHTLAMMAGARSAVSG